MEINRKRVARRLVSGLVAGALALGGLAISGGSVSAKTPVSPTTNRLAGDDRYETAVELARDEFGTPSNGIVIASGESPYDALAAATLAGTNKPVLLTRSSSLPSSVADYLDDVKGTVKAPTVTGQYKIYVIGGTSAVSDDVIEAVKSIVTAGDATPASVVRIFGADRYETAKAIANTLGVMTSTDRLILVNGQDGRWADALSAGPIAAKNGWPIVLTDGTLSGAALDTVNAYLAIPGSSGEFLIVGGPAVMPSSIDEALVGLGVTPADIDRRGGVDRYHTSFLMNLYGLAVLLGGEGESAAGDFGGDLVALVSGEAPYDSIAASSWAAANMTHLMLTPSASLGTFGTTLAGALTKANFPTDLYVIGGKSAVSDSVKATFIATSQSRNLTSTLTDCTDNVKEITLTLSGKLDGAATLNNEIGELTLASAAAFDLKYGALFELNGVKQSTTDFIDVISIDDEEITITLNTELNPEDEVEFAGIPEGYESTAAAFTWQRGIGGASCVVVEDLTPPTATIKAVATSGDVLDHFLVTASEPIDGAALAAADIGGYTEGTLTATKVDTAGKVFRITDGTPGALVNGTTVVTLDKGDIVDLSSAGNTALADASVKAAADATPATTSSLAITCEDGSNLATATKGQITVDAVATGNASGVAGNNYKLIVTSQRGLLIPTVTVDDTAKTITVVADAGYHTGEDVYTVSRNAGISANWDLSSSSGTLTSTSLTTGVLTAGGDQDCSWLIASSEPTTLSSGVLTVNGVVTGSPQTIIAASADAAGAGDSTVHKVDFTTTQSGSVVLSMNSDDIAASAAVATTVSTTL